MITNGVLIKIIHICGLSVFVSSLFLLKREGERNVRLRIFKKNHLLRNQTYIQILKSAPYLLSSFGTIFYERDQESTSLGLSVVCIV